MTYIHGFLAAHESLLKRLDDPKALLERSIVRELVLDEEPMALIVEYIENLFLGEDYKEALRKYAQLEASDMLWRTGLLPEELRSHDQVVYLRTFNDGWNLCHYHPDLHTHAPAVVGIPLADLPETRETGFFWDGWINAKLCYLHDGWKAEVLAQTRSRIVFKPDSFTMTDEVPNIINPFAWVQLDVPFYGGAVPFYGDGYREVETENVHFRVDGKPCVWDAERISVQDDGYCVYRRFFSLARVEAIPWVLPYG